MKKVREKKTRRWIIPLSILGILLFFYFLQTVWVHREKDFTPDYPKEVLTDNTDYETFFKQTGLGKQAVEKLLSEKRFVDIQEVQDAFFSRDHVECKSIFGYFTMSDRVDAKDSAPLIDLQPGDILLSLSTHSIGWRHGHAGLVLDENAVLECTTLGKDSCIVKPKHWRKYSNYAVLRVKGLTEEEGLKVVEYAREKLCNVPYRITAGFLGDKAPDLKSSFFGLQCAYLVWYAWQQFGYDLDSDGGRLVTAYDILYSEHLEVVQIYGMNPFSFTIENDVL